jgi:hypothetical protein
MKTRRNSVSNKGAHKHTPAKDTDLWAGSFDNSIEKFLRLSLGPFLLLFLTPIFVNVAALAAKHHDSSFMSLLTAYHLDASSISTLFNSQGSSHPVKALLGRRGASVVYIIVGISALLLSLRRDVYRPFLGQTLFPAEALTLKTPQGANESVTIRTKPGAKVIYWAAEPEVHSNGASLNTWDKAYKNNENSGVVKADDQGNAVLRIRGPPQPYKVGILSFVL